MKLKPQKIKEVTQSTKFCYGYLDFVAKSPQDYFNKLMEDYDRVFYEMVRRKSIGVDLYKFTNRLDWLKSEIDIMKIELQEDFIYSPTKKIKVNSITDIIYHEGLYGKEIYKEEFCNKEHL